MPAVPKPSSQAAQVFLCAGAINSTELLLRCRDEHGTLPKLSQMLGHRYSGNGDFIAFSFDNAQAFEPSNGPTITSALVYDRAIGDYPVWFLVEDGGYPKELSALVHLLHPKAAVARRTPRGADARGDAGSRQSCNRVHAGTRRRSVRRA